MTDGFVSAKKLPDFGLWKRLEEKRRPLSFDLEVTARCNNDCRHCYINLPAGDREAKAHELTADEIFRIADEAIELGALWCLLTGGEPLVREDFAEIYLGLRRRGLLVSVFTNACLVTPELVDLFRRYPPRDIEVTVYGATRKTYERVSCRSGSFAAFNRGLELLVGAGLKVRLKAMALRSNVHELETIGAFCRERTKDYYRFDPFLHLRFDGDAARNEEIRSERLSPEEIVAIEKGDPARFEALRENCDLLIFDGPDEPGTDHLFRCGAGLGSFVVGHDGTFRLCSSLWQPGTTVGLREMSLAEAWLTIPSVRDLRSSHRPYVERCRQCPIVNLCLWCPAHAALETGALDAWVEYFCAVAHARQEQLDEKPMHHLQEPQRSCPVNTYDVKR